MDYPFQRIIPVDRKGIIVLANTCCYTYMKNRKTLLAGEHIRDFFPDIGFDNAIRDEQKVLSEVCRFGGEQVLVNCVPVTGDSGEFDCVLTFQGAEQIQAEEGKPRKRIHSDGFTAKYGFPHILHKDGCIEAVISQTVESSYPDSNILIHGETGIGRELFAQSTYNSSCRRKGPFVATNCTALLESLLENELFGCMEGAFTEASRGGKMEFFEVAHKGAIFLNEIGNIPPKLQGRLLRVIQEREVTQPDNDMVIPVDVCVICATNRDLEKEVARGSFRGGLPYRLDVLELNLPPLRRRKQDILYLADRMVCFEHECIRSRPEAISQEDRELLIRYDWPDNVREIRNFYGRICILCEKTRTGAEDVLRAFPGKWEHGEMADSRRVDSSFGGTYLQTSGNHVVASTVGCHALRLEDAQRQTVEDALGPCSYYRDRMAAYLGIDKNTLWREMKKYGIEGQADDKERQMQGIPGSRNARYKV